MTGEMLIWDQHACLPLDPRTSFDPVARHHEAGAGFVSLNIAYGPTPAHDALAVLRAFRQHVLGDDRYVLAEDVLAVDAAHAEGTTAVAFDIEGLDVATLSHADGTTVADPDRIATFYDLGVRTSLMTYNAANGLGHGAHDPDPDAGLTTAGRVLVAAMNEVGMVVDASHCSYGTARNCSRSPPPR